MKDRDVYDYILKLDVEISEETPTTIPNDRGFAKRMIGVSLANPLIHERDEVEKAAFFGPWGVDIGNDDSSVRMRVGYMTGSGNKLSLLVDGFYFHREDVPTLTLYETYKSCGDCKGSNGGCPAFAPLFSRLKRNCEYVYVIVVHIDTSWGIRYATPESGWMQRRILKQLMYSDRLSEYYINRLRNSLGTFTLGVGNCTGCRPKECTVISEGYCKAPKKRNFSMEATGVDCDELQHMLYGEYLPWYYGGTKKLPTYLSRYAATFCESDLDYHKLLSDFVVADKSFLPENEVPNVDPLDRELLEVPRGVHKGYKQYVYIDPGAIVD